MEGPGGIFPGVMSRGNYCRIRKGPNALKGCAVVTTGKIVGFQEGIIDMTGPGG